MQHRRPLLLEKASEALRDPGHLEAALLSLLPLVVNHSDVLRRSAGLSVTAAVIGSDFS